MILGLEVADIVLFQVDTQSVKLSVELVVLTFGIIVGDQCSTVDAHVECLVGGEDEGHGLTDAPLGDHLFIDVQRPFASSDG